MSPLAAGGVLAPLWPLACGEQHLCPSVYVRGTQPFNDVVIGCASLKYFQQNSATLPTQNPRRAVNHTRAPKCPRPRHSASFAFLVPSFLPSPLTACCRICHVDLSTGTCWQGLQIIFDQGRPTLEHQQQAASVKDRSFFQRNLELVAPLQLGSRAPGGGGAACNLRNFEAVTLVRVSMARSR